MSVYLEQSVNMKIVIRAKQDLTKILYESRIKGEVKVVRIQGDFKTTLKQESSDASVVFLGFRVDQQIEQAPTCINILQSS